MPEQFLARDVYPVWKRQVNAAKTAVWVLTPYLDHSVVRLLSIVGAATERIVVTDLSPAAGPTSYRKKLLALKKLLEQDISVRSVHRLHAKALVVDNAVLVAGSQNFTSYARSSKEVSAISVVTQAKALETISQWVAESRQVDLELIEMLLTATNKQAKLVDETVDELDALVSHMITELDNERAEKNRLANEIAGIDPNSPPTFQKAAGVLQERVAESPWRPQMGVAFLTPDTATTNTAWGADDEYPTMFGTNSWGDRAGVDLTLWFRRFGEVRLPLRLKRLYFYPMIHLPVGRMVFVRIAKSRITYVKHGFRYTGPTYVADKGISLGVSLPRDLIGGANMIIEVHPWAGANEKYQIGIQFDGRDYEIKWEKPAFGALASYAEKAARIVIDELSEPRRGAIVIQKLLEPITFSELGRENKNAAKFFEHKEHELRLIEFGTAKLFVAVME